MEKIDISQIVNQFNLEGIVTSISSFGGGHINDTFRVETDRMKYYILQKINKNVFKQPLQVVENIEKLLSHFTTKGDKSLMTFETKTGLKYHSDINHDIWRVYNFVQGAQSHEVIEKKSQAFEAAKAFAKFQLKSVDLNPSEFSETIPNFHHLCKRYEKFDQVLKSNPKKRAELVVNEIQFAQDQRKIADIVLELIASGKLPVRVTHNDTKLNNALLNSETGKGVCVIDLDTVMPGLVLYDFGDMARTFTSPVPEDERDFSKVYLRKEIFEELTQGYLSVLSGVLTQTEKDNLLLGAKYMTLIMGLRFLTDYIEGDVYYKIKSEDHNLVRARNQFTLFASMESQESELVEIINKASKV